ncbi:hypothetical protein BD414DRAFT_151522 [Trametes punicea]|nr:hypothetical protein BD414DRAFT_151522 [Trametes punicea]
MNYVQPSVNGPWAFGLGMMPLYCGDKAAKYDPEGASQRTLEVTEALHAGDMHIVPLFSQSIFLPLSYLCHLWPIRAAERLPDIASMPSRPAAFPPLVIQYREESFAPTRSLDTPLPGIANARSVTQFGFGKRQFDTETCVGHIIVDYLETARCVLA